MNRWFSLAWRRWAFWLCVLAVLVLALMKPTHYMPTTGWDKSNLALAFAVMAVLGALAYPGRWARLLLALLGYGVLIEVLQYFTGYRDSDWHDVVAHAVGLVIAWPIARRLIDMVLPRARSDD